MNGTGRKGTSIGVDCKREWQSPAASRKVEGAMWQPVRSD